MANQTVKELKVIAKKFGIKGYSYLNKAELQKIIKKYQNSCTSNKILNPSSGRCVLKNGKIGRELLGETTKYEKKLTSKWVIYTKNGCPFCSKAKDLLKSNKILFKNIQITDSNRNEIFKKLDPMTGNYRYFPLIFNKNNFVGGYSELVKMMK
jgi:glutaredoxin 3